MKYAVISDIHGNLPAFKAVLQDAKEQKAERYIFLGDYYGGYSDGNEVLAIIRNMKNAGVITGNGQTVKLLRAIGRLTICPRKTWNISRICRRKSPKPA